MATQQKIELVRCGPFGTLDSTTTDVYADPTSGQIVSNVDVNRADKGFSTALGRSGLISIGTDNTQVITQIAPFEPCQLNRYILASLSPAGTLWAYGAYTPPNVGAGTQAIVANGLPFSQAVQYNLGAYTTSGQQIIQPYSYYNSGTMTTTGGPGTFPIAYRWQYQTQLALVSAAITAGAGALAAATYYYAFTLEITLPGLPVPFPVSGSTSSFGLGNQETSGFGALPTPVSNVYPYQVTLGAAGSGVVNTVTVGGANIWSGTFADGAKWNINIYRMSSNQPTWYLLASSTITSATISTLTNGVALTDVAADSTISANQQLTIYAEPPPITAQQPTLSNANAFAFVNVPGCIFSHKERIWSFVLQNTGAGTFGYTQSQLWYSGYGTPWQFDPVNQVILVGNDGVPITNEIDSYRSSGGTQQTGPGGGYGITQYSVYGDAPQQGASLSSVGVLFMRKTLWILYGDDENDFVVRKVGQYGCVAADSVAVCQGLVLWLNEEGIFSFDGASAPQYISEEVRITLEGIHTADQRNANSWFANRSYYISFPTGPVANQITLVYYFPTKTWRTLPYATNSAFSIPNEVNGAFGQSSVVDKFQAIFGVRGSTQPNAYFIDNWETTDSDLGNPVVGTWQSNETDSGKPGMRKWYDRVVLNAPIQDAVVQVQFVIDPGSNPPKVSNWTFDLSKGPTSVGTVGNAAGDSTGFLAYIQVTAQSNFTTNPNTPVTIFSLSVLGNMLEEAVAYDNSAIR